MAFNIEEELKKLPSKPGVYLMHDERDAIIYVGKAISLKNRVRQSPILRALSILSRIQSWRLWFWSAI